MTLIFNRKKQKPQRQQLRNNATSAERLLWRYLKGSQVAGVKFRRQHGIGPYVMDFFSHECMLAIELDGPTHSSKSEMAHDRKREHFISIYGIKTIRFTNNEVYKSLDGVVARIEEAVLERRGHVSPHPRLLPTLSGSGGQAALPSTRGGALHTGPSTRKDALS